MSNVPKVSILVTVYNRELYLEQTLRSVLQSSFLDFEAIVVDDCSADSSAALARQISSSDSRIKIYVNEKNLGDYKNRNRAASLAKGKYLKYLDADDLIYRHSLASMVDAMERFPDAALALSRNVIDPEEPYPKLYSPKEFFREHYFGKSPIGVGPSAAIIRRECFEAVGGFSGRQFVGDTELWMKLAERWPIVTLPPALVWWRRHEGQQMQLELKTPEVLNTRFQLEVDALKLSTHFTDLEKEKALRKIRLTHARQLTSFGVRKQRPLIAWRLAQSAGLSLGDFFKGLLRRA